MKMTLQKALSLFQFTSLETVTVDQIKKRYLDLAQKKHPDKGGSTHEFIELKDAYTYLKKLVSDDQPFANTTSQSYNTTKSEQEKTSYNNSTNSNSGAKVSVDRDYLRQLESVNSELTEQNKKYYSVLVNYEAMLNKEIELINKMNTKLTKIANDFNSASDKNKKDRDKQIEELKKQYSPAFKDLINPFQRRIDNEEFLWRQNTIIQEFEETKLELEMNFLNAMVDVYQGSFENISEILEKN
ncbi:MAG: DnaJ domain-containing protein [Patescibacteria group bacterium]